MFRKLIPFLLVLFLLVSPPAARAERNDVVDKSRSDVSTVSEVLMASNPARRWVMIYNPNVAGTYLGISVGATVPTVTAAGVGGAGTIVLAPGGVMEFDSGDTQNYPLSNAFNVVASAGSGILVTAWER